MLKENKNSLFKNIINKIRNFLKSNDYLIISFEMSFLPKESTYND